MNLSIELKIVEDEDKNNKAQTTSRTEVSGEELQKTQATDDLDNNNKTDTELKLPKTLKIEEDSVKTVSSEEDILNSVSFPKVNIVQYRRNSSVNEDDIKLRRGNLEDFHDLSNKRSKSLNNSLDATYLSYDINLNENADTNGNEEPQKVVCKLYDEAARKQSIDTISSTEKEFMEIDRATRELEREISKLNSALNEDDLPGPDDRLSVTEIKKRFDRNGGASSPNPIPKPRRSHYGGSNSP